MMRGQDMNLNASEAMMHQPVSLLPVLVLAVVGPIKQAEVVSDGGGGSSTRATARASSMIRSSKTKEVSCCCFLPSCEVVAHPPPTLFPSFLVVEYMLM